MPISNFMPKFGEQLEQKIKAKAKKESPEIVNLKLSLFKKIFTKKGG